MMVKRFIEGQLVEYTINGVQQSLTKPEKKAFGWPVWARVLRQFSTPEDKGIGDVVQRIIGDENSVAFQVWFQKIFKRSCNCKGRLKRWNSQYAF